MRWKASEKTKKGTISMKKNARIEPIQKTWLNKGEACAYLGCSDDYLLKLRSNAEVSFAKDGKMIWYELESINRFLQRRKVV